jgi:esterase/lipase
MDDEQPDDIEIPSLALYLSEFGRAAFEASAVAFSARKMVPPAKGNPGVILVVPGFTTDSKATVVLRRMLASAGYDVHGWSQGLNLGIRKNLFDGLAAEFDRLHARYRCEISVIGQSLGGIYARELAKVRPQHVNHVVTLGTPINDPQGAGSRVAGLYKLLNRDHSRDEETSHPFRAWNISDAPPVRTTAIYSKSDGICHWRTCIQHGNHAHVENLEIQGSHLGMGVNGRVLVAISERLAT